MEISKRHISEINYRINGNVKPPTIALDYPAYPYSIFKSKMQKKTSNFYARARARVKKSIRHVFNRSIRKTVNIWIFFSKKRNEMQR